jgi:hypothetical protein
VLFSFYIAFVPQRAVYRHSRLQPLEKTMTDFPRFGKRQQAATQLLWKLTPLVHWSNLCAFGEVQGLEGF